MEALGRLLDIGVGLAPVADIEAGANTGKFIHMNRASALTVVGYFAAVSAGTDTVTLALKQSTSATGTGKKDLASIGHFYIKSATALDNTETWSKVDNLSSGAPQASVALTGSTYAAKQLIVAFTVDGASLDDTFEWVSVDIADPGSGGTRPGCVLMLPHDLFVQRAPANLRNLNA